MSVVEVFNGMPADALGEVEWRKSGRSNSTGNCVEFARVAGRVAVRDSKDPHGPALVFDRAEVAELVAGLKAGAYDGLLTGV
ncbi:MAG TPA: DUF397 domain-containing protein [Kineosporiaceae bacterium]|nr:DUF397 domain-containing protein [Kineosporiaceae bacterium]